MEGSIFRYRVPPLWPTYIGERRTTFAIRGKSDVLLGTLALPCRKQGGKKKQKLAWKVDCPMSKWKVNSAHSPLSTPNTT